jgi:hypothetical protein
MKPRKDICIAGARTIGEWEDRKAGLVVGGPPEPWATAFRDFFLERLRTRYFAPIDILRKRESHRRNGQNAWQGEGFAIVALQCSLIEFLGSTLEGSHYKFRRNKNIPLGNYEYDDSKDLFVRFLTTAPPFKAVFTKALAQDFYANVRCGLLHEARTKNRWTILAIPTTGPCVDAKTKIIYRDDLQDAFIAFTEWYGAELPKNKGYQEAFLRKFESLCEV